MQQMPQTSNTVASQQETQINAPQIEILSIQNVQELQEKLTQYGVNTDNWRKNLQDLFKEITDGETQLKVVDGQLERHTSTALINVISPDGLSKLVEDRQEFKQLLDVDGNIIQEEKTLRRGLTELAEKFKAGEPDPFEVVKRALTEELGYPKNSDVFDGVEVKTLPLPLNNVAPKSAYDGLTTINDIQRFLVRMPPELYKPDGYVEDQPKKTNYMVWRTRDELLREKKEKKDRELNSN